MKKKFQFNLFSTVASFLILLAPAMVQQSGCILLWGEPECPECLKK